MRNLFRLTERQMKLIRPFLPKPRGRPGVDDLMVRAT